MSMFNWTVVHDGKTPPPGEAVGPMERLSWGRTAGLGAQHVVAMFGATFVFPLVMGLDPNLAILFSGICTIMFLLIVSNRVPSYLGTSASFVASVAAIRAQGGDSADVTGSIMVAGLVLALVGVLVHFAGARLIHLHWVFAFSLPGARQVVLLRSRAQCLIGKQDQRQRAMGAFAQLLRQCLEQPRCRVGRRYEQRKAQLDGQSHGVGLSL